MKDWILDNDKSLGKTQNTECLAMIKVQTYHGGLDIWQVLMSQEVKGFGKVDKYWCWIRLKSQLNEF